MRDGYTYLGMRLVPTLGTPMYAPSIGYYGYRCNLSGRGELWNKYLPVARTHTVEENLRKAVIPRHTGRTSQHRPVGPALRTASRKTTTEEDRSRGPSR